MTRGRFSAKKRVDDGLKNKGFVSRVLDLKGLDLFKIESDDSLYLDIALRQAGHNNPYTSAGDLSFERTYWMHRGLGPDGKDSVPCAWKNEGKPCPVCNHIKELRSSTDPDAEAQLKSLLPKERQLYLVRDVANDDKWKVWDISVHLFGKLLNGVINDLDDDEQDFAYFPDPESGYTLKVSLNEKSFAGNAFYEAFGVGFKKRKNNYTIEEMNKLPCLDDMIRPANYDDVATLLAGENPAEKKANMASQGTGSADEPAPPVDDEPAPPVDDEPAPPVDDEPAPPVVDEPASEDDWAW